MHCSLAFKGASSKDRHITPKEKRLWIGYTDPKTSTLRASTEAQIGAGRLQVWPNVSREVFAKCVLGTPMDGLLDMYNSGLPSRPSLLFVLTWRGLTSFQHPNRFYSLHYESIHHLWCNQDGANWSTEYLSRFTGNNQSKHHLGMICRSLFNDEEVVEESINIFRSSA